MRVRRRGPALRAALLLGVLAGCAPTPPASRTPEPAAGGGVPLRVAIVGRAASVRIGGTEAWQLERTDGGEIVARAQGGEWRIESGSGPASSLQAVAPDGTRMAAGPGPLLAHAATRGALLTVEGRAYRGTVSIVATDTGLLVINRVPLEEYLRGVVPIEMGRRTEGEREALAAQAVAARGFALRRRNAATGPGDYDVVATILAQAYGGALAEYDLANEAIARTAGLVLTYEGRPIEAVYSSTCGGSTAAASEVWRSSDLPYLRPVSDAIPGTGDYYCSPSPRFRWTRDFDATALAAVLDAHLPVYAPGSAGGVGRVRDLSVESTTASGRVGSLVVRTDRGSFTVRGNDVRYVLRDGNGGILPSTYFSLATRRDAAGGIAGASLAGRGNGHGIGMCQWGAIGRARAGQGYRQILEAYYPGATVARAD